ncbi:MAG: hydrogenase maturation nickel metallochaperone HypA, partial [Kiritimatiellae bacterium]|nr:hydrogenase maturation nickel metallochaperone HypA [Kiritimatiellia bacterium]
MHEFGIVQSWLSAAREAAAGRPVSALRVRVGALSGAEPDALSFAFSAAAPDALATSDPRLEIETVPATRRCTSCSTVYPFPGTGPACPSCG